MKLSTLTATIALLISICAASVAAQPGVKKNAKAPVSTVPSALEIAETGSFTGDTYKNDFLRISVTPPKGWELTSDDANKAGLTNALDKIKANESQKRQQELEQSISNTRILFQARTPASGAAGSLAIMSCGIERLSTPQTQSQYAGFNKQLVLDKTEGAVLDKDIYTKNIGGVPFSTFDVTVTKPNVTYHQTYLITMRKNVAFFFIFTYLDKEQSEVMSRSLGTLSFKK
jgi:hypothetical protein